MGNLTLKGENLIGPEGGPFARFDSDVTDLTDNGVMGMAGTMIEAKKATAKAGKQFMETRVDDIVLLVEALKKAQIEDLLTKPLPEEE